MADLKLKGQALWRCPVCKYEQRAEPGWAFIAIYDHNGDPVASTRACPVCLAHKLNELLPQMEVVDG